jgi:hypothetical protein
LADTSQMMVSPPNSSPTRLVLHQHLLDASGVGVGLVDLVDGHDDRHVGVAGVLDGLDRGRHDAVVGGDHQHDHVGDLGAAGTHRRERLVAGRVEEGRRRPWPSTL